MFTRSLTTTKQQAISLLFITVIVKPEKAVNCYRICGIGRAKVRDEEGGFMLCMSLWKEDMAPKQGKADAQQAFDADFRFKCLIRAHAHSTEKRNCVAAVVVVNGESSGI